MAKLYGVVTLIFFRIALCAPQSTAHKFNGFIKIGPRSNSQVHWVSANPESGNYQKGPICVNDSNGS